jgi:hypothetical protein
MKGNVQAVRRFDQVIASLEDRISHVVPGSGSTLGVRFYSAIRAYLANTYIDDKELAARWKVSVSLVRKMRINGDGPRFTRISAGVIRYSVLDVFAYEREQAFASTAEYDRSPPTQAVSEN